MQQKEFIQNLNKMDTGSQNNKCDQCYIKYNCNQRISNHAILCTQNHSRYIENCLSYKLNVLSNPPVSYPEYNYSICEFHYDRGHNGLQKTHLSWAHSVFHDSQPYSHLKIKIGKIQTHNKYCSLSCRIQLLIM